MRHAPDLNTERGLVGPGQLIASVDEVGRGALAGPVATGLTILDPHAVTNQPAGLGDSKDVAPARRLDLVPLIQEWVLSWGVGLAEAEEVDDLGIVGALRLAGRRAYDQAMHLLAQRSQARTKVTVPGPAGPPIVVLLDGSHDWLTEPEPDLLTAATAAPVQHEFDLPPVTTRVKADRDCAAVSAASILAKTTRDAIMQELAREHPMFAWERNKGYGSVAHKAAILTHGPTELHRRTWKLT